MSSSSQENIVPTNSQAFHMADAQPGGITVTKEVQVTVESTEVQFIHAALVGLVQGEMANSKIMNRERRNRR